MSDPRASSPPPSVPGLAKARLIEGGNARVASLAGFPELCRELGVDPRPLLIRHGLDEDIFSDPDNEISLLAVDKLLVDAAEATGCRHFGLLLGERQDPVLLGPLLLVALRADTIREAFADVQRLFNVHNNGADLIVREDGDLAALCYVVRLWRYAASPQGVSLAMALALKVLRYVCGKSLEPIEITFACPKPDDLAPYWRYFRCRMTFGREESAVWFSSDWLSRPVANANPSLGRVVDDYLTIRGLDRTPDWPAQVRRVVNTLLPTGKANIEHVAKVYGVSRRTLHRRLAEHDTTFEQIVDDARYSVAERLLLSSCLPLTEIAAQAGFSDASAFSRAFRRRAGVAPSKLRKTGL